MPDFIDEAHERIAAFAEEFLDEDDRESFIDELLERRGYQRVTSWAAPEPEPPASGGRPPVLKPRKQASQGGRQNGGQPADQARTGYFRR